MKKLSLLLVVLVINIFGINIASATLYTLNGTIEQVRMFDKVIRPSWASGAWFSIDGATDAGSCLKENGLVAIEIQDNEELMFSSVLAAFMAGKVITADVDDSFLSENGFCVLQFLTLTK